MRKKLGSVICALCVMLTLCLGCFMPVSAEDGSGTLKLICKANNNIPTDMMWWIYRIGSYDGKEITLEDQFADCPVSFGDYSASALSDAASTLETMALLNKKEYDKKMTDSNGEITFTDVRDGVYLVASKKFKSGDKTFKPSPSIIVMDSSQTADMTVYTKMTSVRTLDGYYERYQVMKVWENEQAMPVKPNKILVEIYSDLELYDTVELNVDNDWKYSWDADVSCDWRIVEKEIPEGCTVIYRDDGRQYVVVNTYKGPTSLETETTSTTVVTTKVSVANESDVTTISTGKETTPATKVTTVIPSSSVTSAATRKPAATTTGENKLPQTGQLWWPVPVMALLGLILLGVGSRIVISNKKEDK
ncbi:MAG: hypothetical protein J6K77_01545 [Ruminococcus sp.]|nr:hypothetical protein [Ruminococcus sp.]